MVKTWWIRRWYFLYISVFTMLTNFRKMCNEKFGVLQTIFRPDAQTLTTHKRIANTRYPIIHDETSFLTRHFRLSNTHNIPILAFPY
ncbi:hypothetical protein HanRHA438_Chr15g0732631 [Helianthus annuus]|nr:hypothetical protein HanRHA438_Chr15g0732631 [Helianthus annuus]